jgi:NAD-reducing hydrogenase large subunit
MAPPELTGKAIALRKFGQEIIATLGGRKVHPNFAVPGGVNSALSLADRDAILAQVDQMIGYVQEGIVVIVDWMDAHEADLAKFAVFSTGYMGMVSPENAVELYDGDIRLVDKQRQEMERYEGKDYLDYIAEHVEPWTYLKFPYYKKMGWPGGVYRVGPLGRLNAAYAWRLR